MVCLSPVGYGVSLTFRALADSDEVLTLETSGKHHIPQATIIPYQPLLIKPMYKCTLHMFCFRFELILSDFMRISKSLAS